MRNLILLVFAFIATTTVYAQPSLSFVVASQTCSENIGTFQIAVTISTPSPTPDSVDIQVVGGNAVYGTNFTYGPVTVIFPANTPYTQLFTVYVIDDSITDGDKTVTFGLANPTGGATIGAISQCTLIMADADTPKLSISPTVETQNENIGTINLAVALNRGVRDTTSVQINLVPTGTTAVNGVDFAFNNTTITWPPDSDGTIALHIPIINNPFYEPQRTIELTLTNPTNGAILTDTTFILTLRANSLDTNQGCSDLFMGQYIQGSGNNQAVQIFNPTAVPIDLSVYSILISANGGATTTAFTLTGTIPSRGVYIVSNPNAVTGITSLANITPAGFTFDGTDAIALLHNADTIDVLGQLHTYPGATGWTVGSGSTQGHTLIRNYYDYTGDTSWSSAESTWDVYAQDMIDSLGFHHADSCGSGGPVATVRFVSTGDTVEQVLQFYYKLIIEVNNPGTDTINFAVAADPARTTALQYYGNDYLWTNHTINAPPGITYDTLQPLEIFPNPEMSPTKKVTFEFINLPGNLVVIPDSIFTLYLTNHNQFIVSFLGAGYSYPKSSGLVEIPVITSTFSPTPSTADVSLSTGSAVLGQDFLFNDTTVTFPGYSTDTQGVWVTIINNNTYQGNKQINFNLSNATNSTYSPVLAITGFTLTIINDDSLAGIPQVNLGNDLTIFPNPVSNILTVKTATDINDITITDLLGNNIAVLGHFKAGASNVDVSPLTPGIYFLKIADSGICTKFIKIK